MHSRKRRRDTVASTPAAIERLATRGLFFAYAALLIALGAITVLAYGSADSVVAASAPAIGAAAVAIALVLGISLLWLRRRMRRHVRALEDDRSGLQVAYDRARLDSLLDGLTGLGNHRAFQEALDDEIHHARATGSTLALLMIDVDDLKQVNDHFGHMAGDEILRAVAQIMSANVRRGDRAFRIGGDEFALLLPGTDVGGAEAIAHHLLAAALSGNHGSFGPFSLTIGTTAFPEFSTARQEMIIHADAALFSGKRHGRTTVERFDPQRHGIADDTRSLAELAAAVERVAQGDQLRPVYQPIFSLRTGGIIGYEGLVRLSPDAAFADPTSLFTAAESTRRTVELDIVCARTVLAGAAPLPGDAYIAINLSPRTLESDAFSAIDVIGLARGVGIDPARLVVELTEREAVEDLARLQAAVESLRRHGVRVAIDDVGAGNAGLRLLSEVDFDIMKVDLSLVQAGAHHEPSEAVLRALAAVAQQRGRTIVAEGIETPDLLEAVLELRFDAGQGYLLGRPAPELVTDGVDLFELMSGASDAETVAA